MSKNLRLYLDIAEETKRLTMEGLEFPAALRKAKEMYKKERCSLPASKRNNDTKTTNYIITDKEYIDNGEVYDIDNGQTIKDLGGF